MEFLTRQSSNQDRNSNDRDIHKCVYIMKNYKLMVLFVKIHYKGLGKMLQTFQYKHFII